MLPLTSAMLSSLRNIESSIGGVTNLIIRQATGEGFNIAEGFKQNTTGKLVGGVGQVALGGVGAIGGALGGAFASGLLGASAGSALGIGLGIATGGIGLLLGSVLGKSGLYINRINAQGENTGKPVKFTMTKELWEASKKENTVTLYYNVETESVGIKINAINSYIENETESDGKVTVTCRNKTKLVFPDKELSVGVHTATGKEWTSSQGVWVPSYTSSYKLEEIDNLREYILKQGKKEV